MNHWLKKIIIAFAIFNLASITFIKGEDTQNVQNLKNAIEDKASALKKINDEIAKTQSVLNQTKDQGRSLQKDINQLTGNINSLNLKIKADEISIEKNGLEVEELNANIEKIKSNIRLKSDGVSASMRTLQQDDSENFLIKLIKNGSLATSIAEAQNIYDLSARLKTDIDGLKSLNDTLNQKLDEVSNKLELIKDEKDNLNNRKTLVVEQKGEQGKLLSMTKSQEKAYTEQLNKLAKEQEEIQKEVEQLESELRTRINSGALPTARSGVLLFPVPDGRITQGYGRTSFALATYKGQYHNGLDIGKYLGAEVLSAENGVVVNLGNQDKYCPKAAYGKFIVIKHNNGLTTLYGHLAQQSVTIGETVKRGQIIGYMAKTGWVTG